MRRHSTETGYSPSCHVLTPLRRTKLPTGTASRPFLYVHVLLFFIVLGFALLFVGESAFIAVDVQRSFESVLDLISYRIIEPVCAVSRGMQSPGRMRVFYHKPHRTGSTAVTNYLACVGAVNGLTPVRSGGELYQEPGATKYSDTWLLSWPRGEKAISFSHALMNRNRWEALDTWLDEDSLVITTIRHPSMRWKTLVKQEERRLEIPPELGCGKTSCAVLNKERIHEYILELARTMDPLSQHKYYLAESKCDRKSAEEIASKFNVVLDEKDLETSSALDKYMHGMGLKTSGCMFGVWSTWGMAHEPDLGIATDDDFKSVESNLRCERDLYEELKKRRDVLGVKQGGI